MGEGHLNSSVVGGSTIETTYRIINASFLTPLSFRYRSRYRLLRTQCPYAKPVYTDGSVKILVPWRADFVMVCNLKTTSKGIDRNFAGRGARG